jgi:hypothetical protein
MIFRVVSLIGTARPRPKPATAVLIPTTWPRPSASAPPELPGFSAASVWMTFSTILHAGRDRAGEPVGIADRDHELSDPKVLRVPERGRDELAAFGPQNGEVGERVGADHLDGDLAPVHEGGADARGAARDDVRGGEHEAVGGDHDAAAAAVHSPAATDAARDPEVRDGGRKALRDPDDSLRIRIEHVLLGRNFGRRDERKIHRSKLAAAGRCTGWRRSRRSTTEA